MKKSIYKNLRPVQNVYTHKAKVTSKMISSFKVTWNPLTFKLENPHLGILLNFREIRMVLLLIFVCSPNKALADCTHIWPHSFIHWPLWTAACFWEWGNCLETNCFLSFWDLPPRKPETPAPLRSSRAPRREKALEWKCDHCVSGALQEPGRSHSLLSVGLEPASAFPATRN